MSNYCTHCGEHLDPVDRFCSNCGRRTSGSLAPRFVVVLSVLSVLLLAGVVAVVVAMTPGDDPQSTVPTAAQSASTTVQSPSTTSTTVGATAAAPVAMNATEIGERFGDAVWKVETDGCGNVGSGSSFAISPTHLVTNHHVVEFDSNPTLVSRDGTTLEGRVLGTSPVPDVAVIEVDGNIVTDLEWAGIDTVSLGDPIVTLGYPAPDGDFTVTPGSVLSFGSEDGYGRFIRTDGQIDHGHSGGPALDAFGAVLGVATSLEANPTGTRIVPQIFASDAVRPVVEAMIEAPTYPDASCEVAAGESPGEGYTDFWTGIVASLSVDTHDYDRAYDWASDFSSDTGLRADVLLTDLYFTLNPGYWAVYSGSFQTRDEANAHCEQVRGSGYDCYSKQVTWYLGE